MPRGKPIKQSDVKLLNGKIMNHYMDITTEYTYDNANNIISVTGTETANYTYDSLNRLKTSTQNGVTTTYEYDSRNNLISETSQNFTKTYEYGGTNGTNGDVHFLTPWVFYKKR